MRIFREGKRIRLQLRDQTAGRSLCDFTIGEDLYEELREHMIEALKANPIDKL